jgi:hypothetical protein
LLDRLDGDINQHDARGRPVLTLAQVGGCLRGQLGQAGVGLAELAVASSSSSIGSSSWRQAAVSRFICARVGSSRWSVAPSGLANRIAAAVRAAAVIDALAERSATQGPHGALSSAPAR